MQKRYLSNSSSFKVCFSYCRARVQFGEETLKTRDWLTIENKTATHQSWLCICVRRRRWFRRRRLLCWFNYLGITCGWDRNEYGSVCANEFVWMCEWIGVDAWINLQVKCIVNNNRLLVDFVGSKCETAFKGLSGHSCLYSTLNNVDTIWVRCEEWLLIRGGRHFNKQIMKATTHPHTHARTRDNNRRG